MDQDKAAFPRPTTGFAQPGMTLREFYAAVYMHAIIGNPKNGLHLQPVDIAAVYAVDMADAMIAELAKDRTHAAP